MPQDISLVLSAQGQVPMQSPPGTNSQLLPLGGLSFAHRSLRANG